jgi:hypothetical protein
VSKTVGRSSSRLRRKPPCTPPPLPALPQEQPPLSPPTQRDLEEAGPSNVVPADFSSQESVCDEGPSRATGSAYGSGSGSGPSRARCV